MHGKGIMFLPNKNFNYGEWYSGKQVREKLEKEEEN